MDSGADVRRVAPAADRNKDAILEVLREVLPAKVAHVVEVAAGTGQHAVYFGARLAQLNWQTSDLPAQHAGIRQWLEEAGLANVLPPLDLDVSADHWPSGDYDGVFSANTAHILSWRGVEAMFRGVGRVLTNGGVFCLYGPFNYGGRYTSESNQEFDYWLHERDPLSGIRDVDDLNVLAGAAGMQLQDDYAMPANNRILCWRKG